MQDKTVDARGELCPKPLIMTKKALAGLDGVLNVLLDNETAFENVKRFLGDNNREYTESRNDGVFMIQVHADGSTAEMSNPEEYCTVPVTLQTQAGKKAPYIIVIDSDTMGKGDDELGAILIQGFCNTIQEMDPLPSDIVFYNSGVRLATKGSPLLPAFQELEKSGIRILVCGTCANFFGITEQVGTGIVSNMYDIMETLVSAGHIVKP